MNHRDVKTYWDQIYSKKNSEEVSWFQDVPTRSLELIQEIHLSQQDSIIDIGGGDSRLVDHLLGVGFKDISILDISDVSFVKAKKRLGEAAKHVTFIASDVTKFNPPKKYMLWHDRATFHFLTTRADIETYLDIANWAIEPEGHLIVSTFSKNGPDKCSGLTVSQYSDTDLKALFQKHFINIRCFEDKHHTPWGTEQNFVYCGFKKR